MALEAFLNIWQQHPCPHTSSVAPMDVSTWAGSITLAFKAPRTRPSLSFQLFLVALHFIAAFPPLCSPCTENLLSLCWSLIEVTDGACGWMGVVRAVESSWPPILPPGLMFLCGSLTQGLVPMCEEGRESCIAAQGGCEDSEGALITYEDLGKYGFLPSPRASVCQGPGARLPPAPWG